MTGRGHAAGARGKLLAASAVLSAALVIGVPAAGAAALKIRTTPALWPGFRTDVSDYVVRCAATKSVRFDVTAPNGTKVAIDGTPKRSGTFSKTRPLKPGQALPFAIATGGRTTAYRVRCLPPDFPTWTYRRSAKPSAPLYIATPAPFVTPGAPAPAGPFAVVFDDHGVPLWWVKSKLPVMQDAKLIAPGQIGWYESQNSFLGSPKGFEIHRLNGSLVRYVKAYTASASEPVATDIHDIVRLSNGDYLLIGYKRRAGTVDLTPCGGPTNATVIDGVIQRIRPGRATPIWSWDTEDHIALGESSFWCSVANIVPLPGGGYAYDIVHLNDLQFLGDAIITSARHTDAAYKIAYPSGNVVWKLGGTLTTRSLAVTGDPYSGTAFAGPHDARRLPDGSVTVHDNGTRRGRPPRAVRFSVNETTHAATLVEQVKGPPGESICCGSSQKLGDRGWLMSWGGYPLITELAPGGAARFSLNLPAHWYSYRAYPVAAGQLSRAALRSGMDAMHPRG